MKQYKLLKDLPDVKAGVLLTENVNGDGYYICFDGKPYLYSWKKEFIEQTPSWFAPITNTLDDLINSAFATDYVNSPFNNGYVRKQVKEIALNYLISQLSEIEEEINKERTKHSSSYTAGCEIRDAYTTAINIILNHKK